MAVWLQGMQGPEKLALICGLSACLTQCHNTFIWKKSGRGLSVWAMWARVRWPYLPKRPIKSPSNWDSGSESRPSAAAASLRNRFHKRWALSSEPPTGARLSRDSSWMGASLGRPGRNPRFSLTRVTFLGTVDIIHLADGYFPYLTAPEFHVGPITIYSTVLLVAAALLTGFLIVWWARHLARGRRNRRLVPA